MSVLQVHSLYRLAMFREGTFNVREGGEKERDSWWKEGAGREEGRGI